MRIAIASDHAGFELKKDLAGILSGRNIDLLDLGPDSGGDTVDYADYAYRVACTVRSGAADRGILICGSGVGMAISANRLPGIRAALVWDEEQAKLSREHNDANVLVLAGRYVNRELLGGLLDVWIATPFDGGRHERRLQKIDAPDLSASGEPSPPGRGKQTFLAGTDPEIARAIRDEQGRQESQLELIASENFTSEAVLEALASVMNNKYAEGYPAKRYYGGCEFVDVAEDLARERVKKLYGADHANVQPHSGSSANIAAYFALLDHGDRILGMNLSHGGHLTHGHPVNFSGRFFEVSTYGVGRETGTIDYDEVRRTARESKPRMIVAGASAYARTLDFEAFRSIADEAGAFLMVDMAHIAGLIAAGLHPNPVPWADVVTSTTHKTLRGPRGGFILCREEHAAAIDKTTFPGMQGGPLMHCIAAKAVCFREASAAQFRVYQEQVLANARALAEELIQAGLAVVSGGTDTHLMLIDLTTKGVSGKKVERGLDQAGITVNKNTVPFDERSPFITSGIRVGTPAVTTRGMGTTEMKMIAGLICRVVDAPRDEDVLAGVRKEVTEMCAAFPLYGM